MKTVMIVQSNAAWIPILVNAISAKLPKLTDYLICTDNFEFALDLVPKEGELVVVTSEMFHDRVSVHKNRGNQKILDSEKNADRLAEEIKKINPKAIVYVFSEFKPSKHDFLDGFIEKTQGDETANVRYLVDIL